MKIGKQSFAFTHPPHIIGSASVVGKEEGKGPLKDSFDVINEDSYWGQDSWEKAESAMQKAALSLAIDKAGHTKQQIELLFSGDLLNQSISSTFAHRESEIPYFGIYGACSTMGEGLILASMTVATGLVQTAAAIASSHFCTAERQFRFPLEYGGQRTPNSQWTVSAAGASIVSKTGIGPKITHVTPGKIVDLGITDVNNMGAAMAPAAYDTIRQHLEDTGRKASDYDLIVTGDLGKLGHKIVSDFFQKDGINLQNYKDCGLMIFDIKKQNMDAGGSGCGASAAVLNGYLLRELMQSKKKRILFCPTGALLSPTSMGQGESIPGICHAVSISMID